MEQVHKKMFQFQNWNLIENCFLRNASNATYLKITIRPTCSKSLPLILSNILNFFNIFFYVFLVQKEDSLPPNSLQLPKSAPIFQFMIEAVLSVAWLASTFKAAFRTLFIIILHFKLIKGKRNNKILFNSQHFKITK